MLIHELKALYQTLADVLKIYEDNNKPFPEGLLYNFLIISNILSEDLYSESLTDKQLNYLKANLKQTETFKKLLTEKGIAI